MARAGRNEKQEIARRGLMFVLSSPSGAGKTTLSRLLLRGGSRRRTVDIGDDASEAAAARSTAAITNSSIATRFDAMVKKGELLEWAEVFGHCYGTPRQPVIKALKAGRDVLFDIDWQGTQQLREKARDDLVSVFILPPTVKELERRLKRRAQDSRAVIVSRMAKAAGEMSHWPEYDYVIVNHDKDCGLCRSAGYSRGRACSGANARSAFPISSAGCKPSCDVPTAMI